MKSVIRLISNTTTANVSFVKANNKTSQVKHRKDFTKNAICKESTHKVKGGLVVADIEGI